MVPNSLVVSLGHGQRNSIIPWLDLRSATLDNCVRASREGSASGSGLV